MFSTIYLCKTTIHCLIFIYFLLFHSSNTLCTDFFYWSDFSLQANNSRTCPPLRSNVDQMNGFRSRSRLQNNVGPLLPCVGFTQVHTNVANFRQKLVVCFFEKVLQEFNFAIQHCLLKELEYIYFLKRQFWRWWRFQKRFCVVTDTIKMIA